MMENNYSLYSPYIGCTAPNYLNTTIPIFIKGNPNDDLASYYSFWVHSGEVINKFIDGCNPEFFTKNLLSFERLKKDKWGNNVDRYFFERDFPMIYQVVCEKPKLLYNHVCNMETLPEYHPALKRMLNNANNKKIEF